jgi:hypothetical protein
MVMGIAADQEAYQKVVHAAIDCQKLPKGKERRSGG